MNSRTRLIIIGLVLAASLWALKDTYRAYMMDQERQSFLDRKDSAGLARWDSINRQDYRDVRANRINLGLDLRGGIYITMEVDVPALLLETAQPDAVDELFQQVINATREEARTSDERVIDIFTRNFDKIARPQGRTLLSYYDFSLGEEANDEGVVKKLSKNIDDAVDQAVEVIRQRIDKYGVSEVTIQKVGGRRLVLELPGVTDEAEIHSLLQTTARLEFKLVKNDANAVRLFKRIDEVLAGKVTADTAKKTDTNQIAKTDSTGKKDSTIAKNDSTGKKDTSGQTATNTDTAADTNKQQAQNPQSDSNANLPYPEAKSDEERSKLYQRDHPFTLMFQSVFNQEGQQPQDLTTAYYLPDEQFPEGDYSFYVPGALRKQIQTLLDRPDVRAAMPQDVLIAFDASPSGVSSETPEGFYGMYVLPKEAELTGDVITDAGPNFDPTNNQPIVQMSMNSDGAAKWAEITGRNIKKRVAVVLDSLVYSAPTVQNKITGGNSQITGSKDIKEAELLAVVLKAGALKAPIKIIEERIVGPSLGEDSIRQGINATLLASLLVVLFMLAYYAFGGVVADLAVLFNVLITLAILAAFHATLTLPGIGGLVLTIGMAVDGNILIYERIREELATGKSLKRAVELGYDKAFTAIIDTHVTTFMTGAILYFFGTGPIKGFAVTLMIGIAATLFTAVFCTKTVFHLMLDRGTTRINFGQPKLEDAKA